MQNSLAGLAHQAKPQVTQAKVNAISGNENPQPTQAEAKINLCEWTLIDRLCYNTNDSPKG